MNKILESKGKPWTVVEVAKLKQMAKDRTPAYVIAAEFGRTVYAIQTKARSEKISLRVFDKPKLTRKEWKAMKRKSL